MALDRTWYNSLVDDDGSGLTGSVWDKADVDSLMDAVDAEIARLNTLASPIPTGFTPLIMGSAGGVPTYSAVAGVYALTGPVVHVMGYIALSSKGSLAGSLLLGGFPFPASNMVVAHSAIHIAYFSGMALPINYISAYFNSSQSHANIVFTPGNGATSSSFLDTSQITANPVFIFGGSYFRM